MIWSYCYKLSVILDYNLNPQPNTYLLTYLALQPRFGQGLPEKIPPFYSISSKVCPVTGHKGRDIAVFRHTSISCISVFLGFVTALNRAFCDGFLASLIIHNADDIWAVELAIEFEIVPAFVHTFYCFRAIYRTENFPLKDD
jgi:hypothetical protein